MKNNEVNALSFGRISFRVIGLLIVLLSVAFSLNVFGQSVNPASALTSSDTSKEIVTKDDSDIEQEKPTNNESVSPQVAAASTYTFATTTTGSLTDMTSGTTQLVAANTDDTASAVTNIGFDFYYMGVRYTQFSANSNGLIRLGGTAVQGASPYQPLAQLNLPLITPYGADLRTHTTGLVRFKVIGAAPNRVLVVEWFNMQSNFNAGGTVDLGFQARLSETTGVIEFVYGSMTMSTLGAADAGSNDPQIGFSSSNLAGTVGSVTAAQSGAPPPTFNGALAVPTNNLYVAGSIVVLSGATDGARRTFSFTPPVPNAPSAINFTGITAVAMNVNWTDNATNEDLFAIYRSTDNINYTFVGTAAEDATAFADSGLTPSTNYFYRVFAVSEGALSTALAGSQVSGAPGNDTCAGLGGLWNTPGTWTDGSVPTATDNVTIGTGCLVTIDSSNALNITIQNGGVLQFENTTARTLTVGQSVTIDAGGLFQSGGGGTVTTHVLSVGGSITNNGILDFSTNTNMAGANITFAAGASNVTFGGNGTTTDIRGITVAKGAQAIQVEMLMLNLTVQGVNTDVAGYLTITSGTFKISGNFTMTNRTFPGPTYVIPLLGGFWLNNPNYTVARTASGTTTLNNGLFRMTQGIYGIGLTGADGMGGGTGSTFIVEGGTINAIRIDPQSATTFTMTGGTINLSDLAANTRSNFGTFELFSATAVSTFDGGTINLINATIAATPVDFRVNGTMNTGASPTVVNVGTAATATNFNFRLSGQTPSVVIDNTTNNKTATFVAQTLLRGNITINPGTTFAINGFLVAPTAQGGFTRTMTNNGTMTGNAVGSRLYFLGQLAGSNVIYTGTGIAGTTALPLLSVDFDSFGGTALGGATNNLITNRVILFQGNVTGANKIELGIGGASIGTTQVGNTTTATNAGTFDGPFTFNLGTGGQVTSYLRTTTNYTTGGEINPTRTLTSMTVDNNVANLNIGGGPITVTGAMTLTNGIVNTSAANLLTHNGAVGRLNGFVAGPLMRSYTAIGLYTYHVGDNVGTAEYSPLAANVTVLTTNPSTLTVAVTDNFFPNGMSMTQSASRFWDLTETGDLTATLDMTYLDPADINGTEASYQVLRREAGVANTFPGGTVNAGTNTANAPNVTMFSQWGAGNIAPVAANASIDGRVSAADGRGIRNAIIEVTGGNLPSPIYVRTGTFGYYRVEGLEVGGTYVVTVRSKRFEFANPSRVITLNESVSGFDFIANAP